MINRKVVACFIALVACVVAQYPGEDDFESEEPVAIFARSRFPRGGGYGGSAEPVAEILHVPNPSYQEIETLPNYGGGSVAPIAPIKQEPHPGGGYGGAPLKGDPSYLAPSPGYGGGPQVLPVKPGYGSGSGPVHDKEPYASVPSYGGGPAPLKPVEPGYGGGPAPLKPVQPGYGGGPAPLKPVQPGYGGGPAPLKPVQPGYGGGPAPAPGYGAGKPHQEPYRQPHSHGYGSGSGISFQNSGWGAPQKGTPSGGGFGTGGGYGNPSGHQHQQHTKPIGGGYGGAGDSYSQAPAVQPGYGAPLVPPPQKAPTGYGR